MASKSEDTVSYADLGKATFDFIRYLQDEEERSISDFTPLAKEFIQEFDIAYLSRELLYVQKNNETGDRLAIATGPENYTNICTEEECEIAMGKCTEMAVVFDGSLLISFNPKDLVTVDGSQYINGDIIIREIDDNGNECDVNFDTIRNFICFKYANLKTITLSDRETDVFLFN